MIQLEAGNVLLKPTQRKQLMSSLRRSLRLGERLGNFALRITMRRCGKCVEMIAKVRDKAGEFSFRVRQANCRFCVRDLIRVLVHRLHDQGLHMAV